MPKLHNHLLGRLLNREFDGCDEHVDFTDEEQNNIYIKNNIIFCHQTAHINYTTYNMRQSFDTINPQTCPFIMVATPEKEPGAHPFWYAQVLGIFHVDVRHTGSRSKDFRTKQMEFLWVHWLGTEPGHISGHMSACLPMVGYVPDSDDDDFGFVDPALILCSCHLIPTFCRGWTTSLLSTVEATDARSAGEKDDWTNYYVNM